MSIPDSDYLLGSSDREHERLIRQAARIAPLTERFLREAGIGPGQRVLDVGSGVGDVAMLAARLVGSAGEVVGVERDSRSVALARRRVTEAECRNVSFTESDIAQISSNKALTTRTPKSRTAKAEPALWTHLKRFHEEWHDREGELRTTSDSGPRDPIVLAILLERALLASIVSGTNWICGPEKFNQLRAITSRQYWSDLSHHIEQWESGRPWALFPDYWDPKKESGLSFHVLQYSGLDEDQIRVKLSQLPRGSRLYFRTMTPNQMAKPVSMEKQQAVLHGLSRYAAQFGVSVEEWPPNKDAS